MTVGEIMSRMGFSVFLVMCTIFGWSFAAAINSSAFAQQAQETRPS